jgi:hypothetical protein
VAGDLPLKIRYGLKKRRIYLYSATKNCRGEDKVRIAISAIGLLILCAGGAVAAFNDIGVGARPLGMGGAFVALADDGNAANYNAAGLGYINAAHLSMTTAQRFSGLINYNHISGIVPLRSVGSIGASIGILSEDEEVYKEQTITVSYGKTFLRKFALGLNLKSFSTLFDENNGSVSAHLENNPQFFAHTSTADFSFDLGMMANPIDGLTLGFSAENLFPANVSVSEAEEDFIPQNIRIGLTYRLATIAATTKQEALREVLKSGLGLFEIGFRDGDRQIHAGAELWLNKMIGVRAGYSLKSGVNRATGIALGGSVKLPVAALRLQLDYAFQIVTGVLADNTTQRFSLNLMFE